MLCPVCGSEHTSRPRHCLQAATLDHVGRCGIDTEHRDECLLKRLNEYVEANPRWKRSTGSQEHSGPE